MINRPQFDDGVAKGIEAIICTLVETLYRNIIEADAKGEPPHQATTEFAHGVALLLKTSYVIDGVLKAHDDLQKAA
jgi:hypothetical protein